MYNTHEVQSKLRSLVAMQQIAKANTFLEMEDYISLFISRTFYDSIVAALAELEILEQVEFNENKTMFGMTFLVSDGLEYDWIMMAAVSVGAPSTSQLPKPTVKGSNNVH